MFEFDVQKAIQAMAHLLKKYPEHRHGSFGSVLKLLYLADRESLLTTGVPISKDRPVAMKNGMLLSGIYNLIKGELGWGDITEDMCDVWNVHFKTGPFLRKSISLVIDPGNGRLCDSDIEILDSIYEQHGQKDFGELIELTHNLPEYIPLENQLKGGGREMVSFEDVFRAGGKENRIDEIKDHARLHTFLNKMA